MMLIVSQNSIYPLYDAPQLCIEYRCDNGVTIEESLKMQNLGLRAADDDESLRELRGDLDVYFRDASRMDRQNLKYGAARGLDLLPEPRLLGDKSLSSDTCLDQIIRSSVAAMQQRTGLHANAAERLKEACARKEDIGEQGH
jgi:hypothetical protein